MKLEIDLHQLLQDEYGSSESLSESVHRQIVEQLSATLKEGIDKRVNAEIATLINERIKSVVETQMPSLVEQLMNAEYHQVDRWGETSKETTTVRKELVKAIQGEMQYKPKQYKSDQNAFTRAVDGAVEEHLKIFKKDFDTKIVELFQKEAFDYAVNKMAERLGLPQVKK